jgi:hypothetical protein
MSFAENAVPSYGPLPADRPHQLRLQALYDFPFGTSVRATFNAASGTPVSRYVSIPPAIAPVYYRGRGSDGRTPALWQVDLYLQHAFKLTGSVRLELSANVLNLFNTDKPTLIRDILTQEEVRSPPRSTWGARASTPRSPPTTSSSTRGSCSRGTTSCRAACASLPGSPSDRAPARAHARRCCPC